MNYLDPFYSEDIKSYKDLKELQNFCQNYEDQKVLRLSYKFSGLDKHLSKKNLKDIELINFEEIL